MADAHEDPDDSLDYYVEGDVDDGHDNEETIDEDELNEPDDSNELADLQEEAEMDIEELRRRYALPPPEFEEAPAAGKSEENKQNGEAADENGDDSARAELAEFMQDGAMMESDDDADYMPLEIHKPPRVGPEYQHSDIPEIDPSYAPPSHLHADILWKPNANISDEYLDQYQESVAMLSNEINADKIPKFDNNDAFLPRTDHPIPFWDSEEALYYLMQNDYDAEKAREAWTKLGPPDVNFPQRTHFGIYMGWTDEDVKQLERGLHDNLKRFEKIRADYLPSRSLGEIIHFYYRWKKTERKDVWLNEHLEMVQAQVQAQAMQAMESAANSTDVMQQVIDSLDNSAIPADQAAAIIAQSEAITDQQIQNNEQQL